MTQEEKRKSLMENGNVKASDECITTHSKARYAAQDYQAILSELLLLQQKEQAVQLSESVGHITALSALFSHTKRDAMQFLCDQMSIRLQLCFSPLDSIDSKIIIPNDGHKETNQKAILAMNIDIDRLPHGLLRSWGKRMNKKYPKKLPRWFSSFLEDQTLRHRYLAIHGEELLPLLKEYFTLGLPTDYFIDEKLTSTPRVISLGGGYLLTQNNPLVYEEKHLQKYSGTDLFFRYFPTKEAYLAYEHQTLEKLKQQKMRFLLWNQAYKVGIHDFITQKKVSIDNNNKKPFGTLTDKRIDQELHKLSEKKNTQYFSQYIQKIGQLLEERLEAIDSMIKTIHGQIEGI